MMTVLTETKRERADIVWPQVVDYYGFTPDELMERAKPQPLAEARQVLMTALYYWAGLTVVEVGHELRRDHSTVIHGVGVTMRKLQPGGGEHRAVLGKALRHILAPCGWTPPLRPQMKGYDAAITLLTGLRQAVVGQEVVGQEVAAWRVDAQRQAGRRRGWLTRAEMEALY